jgi:hypothetical protein
MDEQRRSACEIKWCAINVKMGDETGKGFSRTQFSELHGGDFWFCRQLSSTKREKISREEQQIELCDGETENCCCYLK